jgi:hypothetical protein
MPDLYSICGWIGMSMVLFAYVRRKRLMPQIYNVLNLAGSILIMIVCYHQKTWPPFALNAAWAFFASKDLLFPDRES